MLGLALSKDLSSPQNRGRSTKNQFSVVRTFDLLQQKKNRTATRNAWVWAMRRPLRSDLTYGRAAAHPPTKAPHLTPWQAGRQAGSGRQYYESLLILLSHCDKGVRVDSKAVRRCVVLLVWGNWQPPPCHGIQFHSIHPALQLQVLRLDRGTQPPSSAGDRKLRPAGRPAISSDLDLESTTSTIAICLGPLG